VNLIKKLRKLAEVKSHLKSLHNSLEQTHKTSKKEEISFPIEINLLTLKLEKPISLENDDTLSKPA
jgi:hypothetical protein